MSTSHLIGSTSKNNPSANSIATLANRLIAASKTQTEVELRTAYAQLAQHYQTLFERNSRLISTLENRQFSQVFQQKNRSVSCTSELHQTGIVNTICVGENSAERTTISHIHAEFIAMVSHELRTPLTAIHGGVKLITQGIVPSQSEQAQELLQIVVANSQRLVQLVDNILMLEFLTSKQCCLNKQRVNTQTLTQRAVDAFHPTLQKHSIGLEVCDPGFDIEADSDRLVQVLANLLDNGIKFSPPGSILKLTVTPKDIDHYEFNNDGSASKFALFSVCDQGKGISVEQRDKIFEQFIQIETADARKQGGTGLGLAICRSIIEQHNGKIWVESTLGKGSCFHFTLPK